LKPLVAARNKGQKITVRQRKQFSDRNSILNMQRRTERQDILDKISEDTLKWKMKLIKLVL
jgi:hypothetical protein